jgi:uncharacterized protein (UPF0333 family)
MARKNNLDNKGQTAVEYILLLLAMVTVIVSLIGYIRKHYLGDISKCTGTERTIVCTTSRIFSPGYGGTQKKFQFYYFKK